MGRKSTKENKNIYQTSRENMGYSRETASEKLEFISEIEEEEMTLFSKTESIFLNVGKKESASFEKLFFLTIIFSL